MTEPSAIPADLPEESPLQCAVRLAGGQSALAREASKHATNGRKLTQRAIWKWLNRARGPVPTDIWVIPIEKAVQGRVTRHQLRADLYPANELQPA